MTKIISLILIAISLAGFYLADVYSAMHTPLPLSETDTIDFPRGSTIRTLANQLIEKKLLDDEKKLLIWTKLNRQTTRLQAGEYILTPGINLADLLENMVAGNVVQYSITLIEGFTFRQILQIVKQNPRVKITLDGLTDAEIMNRIGYAGEHPEGRFYPDTYFIANGVSDAELLIRAYQSMRKVLDQEWQTRQEDLPYKTPYEALIMASIVEKESAVAEERPLIAGLFVNRLRKKMRLQTDPTVIYGIENYDGNIRFRDLRKDTPYNTYTRAGLPPTPIAMPGREAIHAALHPAETEFLYFVAFGDGSGKHIFSTNLKDHERAVDQYQRKKKRK